MCHVRGGGRRDDAISFDNDRELLRRGGRLVEAGDQENQSDSYARGSARVSPRRGALGRGECFATGRCLFVFLCFLLIA